jgi:hypothetical protein
MTQMYASVSQLMQDHANNGHVDPNSLAEVSKQIDALPNDSALDLRVIDTLVGVLGRLT